MKRDLAKIRSIASLFLEVLMLVFIFAYVDENVETSDTSDKENSSAGIVLKDIVARPATSLFHPSLTFSKHQIQRCDLFSLPAAVHGGCLAIKEALSVGQFERNTFYIASADNVP